MNAFNMNDWKCEKEAVKEFTWASLGRFFDSPSIQFNLMAPNLFQSVFREFSERLIVVDTDFRGIQNPSQIDCAHKTKNFYL